MSKSNSSMATPDAFIMYPDDVNEAIASFLESYDFFVVKGKNNTDVDLKAFKNGTELIIESRGNQALRHKDTDKVFDGSQLDIHLSEQVTQIMRFQQAYSERKRIFIMGNPKITRLTDRVAKISKALDKLEIVRLWVDDISDEISFEGPKPLLDQYIKLLDDFNLICQVHKRTNLHDQNQ